MKNTNTRVIYMYCIYFLFIIFFGSCAALRGKKCDCPSWSMEQIKEDEKNISLNAAEV